MAITISSISASATLAFSGLALLWGSPGNFTTDLIGTIVHSAALFLAHGDQAVASIWLIRAPIALIAYLLINTVPLVIGCIAIEVWSLRDGQAEATGANTAP
ncbi:hypothetical protein WS98_21755 [Burkholderia territorii]|uniref:hypothetical protein n=1 Tax=Burkholderia territorii TaxID=1503055 RepID=UPI00075CC50A|nr:hypothetical protein [Burkholderia territorii]KVL32165.1 hypothetical protein WS98_21755 [Burkholderia territorii]